MCTFTLTTLLVFERLQGNLHLRKRAKERMFCLWQMLFRIPKCLSAIKNSFTLTYGRFIIHFNSLCFTKEETPWVAAKQCLEMADCFLHLQLMSHSSPRHKCSLLYRSGLQQWDTHRERNSQIHCQPAHGLHFNASAQQESCGEGHQYQKHSRWKNICLGNFYYLA